MECETETEGEKISRVVKSKALTLLGFMHESPVKIRRPRTTAGERQRDEWIRKALVCLHSIIVDPMQTDSKTDSSLEWGSVAP